MRHCLPLTLRRVFAVVGSELIQKYLGDGPKLVRELFRVADELAPSIVFIGALIHSCVIAMSQQR